MEMLYFKRFFHMRLYPSQHTDHFKSIITDKVILVFDINI